MTRTGANVLAILVWGVLTTIGVTPSPTIRGLDQRGQDRTLTHDVRTAPRTALVIGNGDYVAAAKLKNSANDAADMTATLKNLGFDVLSGINLNQREMKKLIREFGTKLKGGGAGLFYYAGHGVQLNGRNYLVPVDADIQSEADLQDIGVDVALVLNYMDQAQNGLNFVIMDACRNNPFAQSFRSVEGGLAQVEAPTGTLIAYATAPGKVAADGSQRNGLYTAALLKAMRIPGLHVTEMFMRVRAEVMKATLNKQVPWEASSLVGAFYFAPPLNRLSETSNTSNVSVEKSKIELSYWETIKHSDDPSDFEAYLLQYPEGEFAALARNSLRRLNAASNKASRTNSTTPSTYPINVAGNLTSLTRGELRFNYPETWILNDESTTEAHAFSLARADSEAQFRVFAYRIPVSTPERVAKARKVLLDPYLASTVQQFEKLGARPQKMPAYTEIAKIQFEGVRIAARLDGVPGAVEIYWGVVGNRFLVLTLLGPDVALKNASPTWDIIRNSIRIQE